MYRVSEAGQRPFRSLIHFREYSSEREEGTPSFIFHLPGLTWRLSADLPLSARWRRNTTRAEGFLDRTGLHDFPGIDNDICLTDDASGGNMRRVGHSVRSGFLATSFPVSCDLQSRLRTI
jgi:hypothetical protein